MPGYNPGGAVSGPAGGVFDALPEFNLGFDPGSLLAGPFMSAAASALQSPPSSAYAESSAAGYASMNSPFVIGGGGVSTGQAVTNMTPWLVLGGLGVAWLMTRK